MDVLPLIGSTRCLGKLRYHVTNTVRGVMRAGDGTTYGREFHTLNAHRAKEIELSKFLRLQKIIITHHQSDIPTNSVKQVRHTLFLCE
jgi:hypothetical protein